MSIFESHGALATHKHALRWAASSFVVGVLVALAWLRGCSQADRPVSLVRAQRTIDTVIRWVPIEPISARVRLRSTVDAATVAAADSTAGRILRERDSLGYLLASAGYHRTMTGDTVLGSGDTISVECDDLLREARLALRLARRPVAVEHVTDSIVVERHPTWPALAVTAGVGVAIAVDGVVRPSAYIGISAPIITLWP